VLRGQSLILGAWNPNGTPPSFGKTPRQQPGTQQTIAITTTPAASLYQNVQVSLLNSAGAFVAPTLQSLSAAEDAMTVSKTNPKLVEFDFSSSRAKRAKDAYPLASPIYIGVNTEIASKSKLMTFANMLSVLTTSGQSVGEAKGQLPGGYAPLSKTLLEAARVSIMQLETGNASPETPTNGTQTGGGQNPVPVVAAGVTPVDPAISVTSVAVPISSGTFVCAFMFYMLLRIRKAKR
jgi:hypothetical protein